MAIPERRLVLLGTEGAIRSDVITGEIEVRRHGFGEETRHAGTEGMGGHGGGDETLAAEMTRAMTEGVPPSTSFHDGMTSSITCFAIDQAMEEGRVVDLAPVWEKAGI